MKKSVVSALTAAVLLGAVSTPAFAAHNPFADVSENHWAYKSVTELADAGIVTGFTRYDSRGNIISGDGNHYVGGESITRYQMAEMLAKALARVEGEGSPFNFHLKGHEWYWTERRGDGSTVDRKVVGSVTPFHLNDGTKVTAEQLQALQELVNEFQDELTTLGVRVDDLKDHSDKLVWHGKVEYTYHHLRHNDDYYDEDEEKVTSNGYVFRLEPVAYIDDNCWVATGNDLAPNDDGYRHGHWTARARLDSSGDLNNDSTNNTKLKRAWIQGDWDKFSVKAGRFEFNPPEGGIVADTVISGGELKFGTKWKATLTAGRINDLNQANEASYLTTAVNDGRLSTAILPEFGNAKSNVVALHVQYADPGDKGIFGGMGYVHAKNNDFANYFYSDDGDKTKAGIWSANLGYRFNDKMVLTGSYARNTKADNEKDAWDVLARYGDYNNASEKGQWAVWAGYSKFGSNVGIASDQTDDIRTGTKGFHLGASWAPFKNFGLIARYARGKYITGGDKFHKFFGRVELFF